MNYFELHIGDYAQATGHLSFVEDAAYFRLVRKYYAEEAPIPADLRAAQRLVGARSREEREAVRTVLEEFFELREDGWHQRRCDEEIARFQDKQAKAKRSAEARWSAQRTQSEGNANASSKEQAKAMRTHSEGNALQTPDTRHQTPDTTYPSDTPSLLAGTNVPAPAEDSAAAYPDCPHQRVLSLWREVMPDLPQHTQWTDTRAAHLRARWRETAVVKGWRTVDDGLTYLRKLFLWLRQSEFLMGKSKQRDPNRKPFVMELEWLLLPSNWAKAHEGKYHPEVTA